MNIISCLTAEHELKYIVASWLICCVGSILFVKLMSRARSSSVATKMNWIVLAGIVGGSTIWTTHFIALAGYFPSVTHLFDPSMAAGTLIFSIILMMAAVGVFSLKIGGWYPQVAGTIIGMGMSGVHGLGMIPYQIQATVEWDIALFITSIAMAAEFGMVATTLLDQPLRRRRIHIAMLSIMLALLSAHFVPMASMTLVPDPNIFPPVIMMKDSILMLIVFTIISLLLICGWVFYRIDIRSAHEARSRLQHLEHHDLLTGLANRTGIGRALEYSINEAAKDGSSRAVLYFDIRRFRNINDVYGYAAGDDILQIVSRRIVSASGDNAVVARVGGDEFVATMKCESIAEVLEFSQKLHSVISKPFIWHSTPLVVETDIGISIYPGDGKTPEMLLSKASMAMVRARNDGVNIAYHDLNRDEAVRSMSELAFDLRYAIERGEFELYYQRQNNVATGDLVGFEALLRWHHPKRGMIAPSDFIPIAETYGYIANIGEWVLRTACMEATRWPHPYKIAVNVASSELSNPHLPDIVADALASSGLDASRLELEMTETGIIDDPSQTRRIIDRLKGVGVSLAMDDYGTGNSSLSTLQSYPFDKIKIDKSFVTRVCTDPQAAAIVHSTVILGKSLKIPILAEGVETECALKYLRQVGCNEVQGFLFGKPMPAGAIRELVA